MKSSGTRVSMFRPRLQIGRSVPVELFKGDRPGLISQVERSSGVRRLSTGRVGERKREAREGPEQREDSSHQEEERSRLSRVLVRGRERNEKSPFTYLFHERDPPLIDGKCRDALSGPSGEKNPQSPPSVIEISTAVPLTFLLPLADQRTIQTIANKLKITRMI